MQAILVSDSALNDWVLAFERLGPFGIQVVLLTAMVWYLRKHIAALLDSKRRQNDATASAMPKLMTVLERIASYLQTLIKHHEPEAGDRPPVRSPGVRDRGVSRASDGGAGSKDLSRVEP